jgi:pyruvate dehydrogenase (quinone)
MIRLEMMVAGYPFFETDHGVTDLAAVARACGVPASAVDDPVELPKALHNALHTPGPYLLDVRTDPNALSIPLTSPQISSAGSPWPPPAPSSTAASAR